MPSSASPMWANSSLVNRMTGRGAGHCIQYCRHHPGRHRQHPWKTEHGKYVLIDTAGIRRKSRVDDDIEKYSVLRAYMAVDRADVCAHCHRRH